MKKILIADDEKLILKLVCDFFSKAGYQTLSAKDGETALKLFSENSDVSLIILDIMMPDIDGWKVCEKIRETSAVPVIMLSARSEEFDLLRGFEVGADEYVTKPFSPNVLVKRAEALMKLYEGKNAPKTEEKGIRIDADAYVVYLDGEPLDLTLKEYEILQCLYNNRGRVFTRDQLLDIIWGYDFYGNSRTVDSHVARLRTKLGTFGEEHLKTIYGTGYKMDD